MEQASFVCSLVTAVVALVSYFLTRRMAKAAEEQAEAAMQALQAALALNEETKFELELVSGACFDLRNRGRRKVHVKVMSGGQGATSRRVIAEDDLEPSQALRFELPLTQGQDLPPQVWVRVDDMPPIAVPVPK
ncbi:hypothetical protein ACF090_01185 [Streptomyces sp. NPDC014892]|uniref:hypothetical protein n=1 Tax=Streptomyces sp. NPDC014892 TaxID=3364930 RepID=UPI0036FE6C0E